MWENVTSLCIDQSRSSISRISQCVFDAKQVTYISLDTEDRAWSTAPRSCLQRDPWEGVVDAGLAKSGARTRDGRLESVRVTPVIRAFVTWSCRVDSPISSGRGPARGAHTCAGSHLHDLPLPSSVRTGEEGAGVAASGREKYSGRRGVSGARWTMFEGAISAGLESGWPTTDIGWRKREKRGVTRLARSEETGSFPCAWERGRRIYLSRKKINNEREKERKSKRDGSIGWRTSNGG